MSNLKISEIKAFVPAKDFELSKRFYQDIGFTNASDANGIVFYCRIFMSKRIVIIL